MNGNISLSFLSAIRAFFIGGGCTKARSLMHVFYCLLTNPGFMLAISIVSYVAPEVGTPVTKQSMRLLKQALGVGDLDPAAKVTTADGKVEENRAAEVNQWNRTPSARRLGHQRVARALTGLCARH